jgi:hypothetical protein
MVATTARGKRSVSHEMEDVYEKYAKPLEADHWGDFVVVAADGRYTLGGTMLEAFQKAESEGFPSHAYLYKVGEKSVGRI